MADGMVQSVKDPILSQIKEQVESKVPASVKRTYLAFVVAGKNLMYSDQTHQIMVGFLKQAVSQGRIPQMVAHGITKVISIVYNEASKKQPMTPEQAVAAGTPAGIVLMCDALDDLENNQKVEITRELVAQTTRLLVAQILTLFKFDGKKIKDAVTKGAPPEAAAGAGEPSALPAQPAPAAPLPASGGGL